MLIVIFNSWELSGDKLLGVWKILRVFIQIAKEIRGYRWDSNGSQYIVVDEWIKWQGVELEEKVSTVAVAE